MIMIDNNDADDGEDDDGDDDVYKPDWVEEIAMLDQRSQDKGSTQTQDDHDHDHDDDDYDENVCWLLGSLEYIQRKCSKGWLKLQESTCEFIDDDDKNMLERLTSVSQESTVWVFS